MHGKTYNGQMQSISHLLDPEVLLRTVGIVGLFVIIFAESGLLIGFFLPGDSLLFTAGILAPAFGVNIFLIAIGSALMAILGDSLGYMIGNKFGPSIFSREKSRLFHPENVKKAQAFFEKKGPSSIILARFIPVIRTFVPVIAGVAKMDYKTFVSYNIIGGIIWGAGLPLLGSYLGKSIPNIDHYLLPIVIGIVILSLIPIAVGLIKSRFGGFDDGKI